MTGNFKILAKALFITYHIYVQFHVPLRHEISKISSSLNQILHYIPVTFPVSPFHMVGLFKQLQAKLNIFILVPPFTTCHIHVALFIPAICHYSSHVTPGLTNTTSWLTTVLCYGSKSDRDRRRYEAIHFSTQLPPGSPISFFFLMQSSVLRSSNCPLCLVSSFTLFFGNLQFLASFFFSPYIILFLCLIKAKGQKFVPHMFYTRQYAHTVYRVSKNVLYPKCQILRIFITIKTIKFGILIYLSDWAVLLAFWGILNQGYRPNKTENTLHYVKRVIFCILIEVGKEGFKSYSA